MVRSSVEQESDVTSRTTPIPAHCQRSRLIEPLAQWALVAIAETYDQLGVPEKMEQINIDPVLQQMLSDPPSLEKDHTQGLDFPWYLETLKQGAKEFLQANPTTADSNTPWGMFPFPVMDVEKEKVEKLSRLLNKESSRLSAHVPVLTQGVEPNLQDKTVNPRKEATKQGRKEIVPEEDVNAKVVESGNTEGVQTASDVVQVPHDENKKGSGEVQAADPAELVLQKPQ